LMNALPVKAQKLITTTHIDWMEDEFEVIQMDGIGAVQPRSN